MRPAKSALYTILRNFNGWIWLYYTNAENVVEQCVHTFHRMSGSCFCFWKNLEQKDTQITKSETWKSQMYGHNAGWPASNILPYLVHLTVHLNGPVRFTVKRALVYPSLQTLTTTPLSLVSGRRRVWWQLRPKNCFCWFSGLSFR